MTTQISKTINASGAGDYTTIQSAFNAVPADLTAVDENWTLTITDSSTYTENASLTTTADATRTVKLTAQAGQSPTVRVLSLIGVNMAVRYATVEKLKFQVGNNEIGVRLSGEESVCQDCEFDRKGTENYGTGINLKGTLDNRYIYRCKFQYLKIGIFNESSNAVIAHNNLFRNVWSRAFDISRYSSSGQIYHNSIDSVGSNGHGIIFRTTKIPTYKVKNNIFKIDFTGTGTRYALHLGPVTSASGLTSDNNRFYVAGTGKVAIIGGTEYPNLTDWQATGQDANSVEGPPDWVDPTNDDYHLNSSDDGEAGLGVTDDLDGNTRSDPGDRGCYEFTGPIVIGRVMGNVGMTSAGFGGGLIAL